VQKNLANILLLFMWPLSAITLSVLTVKSLYKVKNPFHVPLFLFCFNFSQSIWLAHLGDANLGGTQPPRCLGEVIHIWSSLLLLIITHH